MDAMKAIVQKVGATSPEGGAIISVTSYLYCYKL